MRISSRLQSHLEDDQRLDRESHRFERLLIDLSAAFVRAAAGSIDLEIERSLERVVLTLGLDRSTVYQVGANGIAFISHQWARPGLPRTPQYTNVLEIAPWVTSRVMSGQTVQFSRLDDLPPEAALDREAYRAGGNRSNVTVPVKFGKRVVGGVGFGSIRKECLWRPEVVQQFELVAQIFGFALERRKTISDTVRLQEELHRSSHIAAMAELATSLAHELYQPLTAILHQAQEALGLLATNQPDLEAVQAALHEIIRHDKRSSQTLGAARRLLRRAHRAESLLVLRERLRELDCVLRTNTARRNVASGFEDEAGTAEASQSADWQRELPAVKRTLDHLIRLHASLTVRERQVFALIAAGLSNKEVGTRLGIAVKTTKIHRGHVMEKMKARSFADLVRIAARLGI